MLCALKCLLNEGKHQWEVVLGLEKWLNLVAESSEMIFQVSRTLWIKAQILEWFWDRHTCLILRCPGEVSLISGLWWILWWQEVVFKDQFPGIVFCLYWSFVLIILLGKPPWGEWDTKWGQPYGFHLHKSHFLMRLCACERTRVHVHTHTHTVKLSVSFFREIQRRMRHFSTEKFCLTD